MTYYLPPQDTGNMGLNPTQEGMDVYLLSSCVCVVLSKESYQVSITQDSNSQETGEPWNRLVCHAIQEEEKMLTLYDCVQKLMMAMSH
jgi:hypothetical protein